MTSFLDRLNLRPFEKRLVVGVGVVLFIVFNFWFVVPHFSDLRQANSRKAEALKKYQRWQAECEQAAKYKAAIASIVGETAEVPFENQTYQFSSAIQMQQAQSGVNVPQTGRTAYRTNDFFIELAQTISVQSGEAQLVDFLYKLGAGTSLIRVSGLDLHTDPPCQQLVGNVTLVASYQKSTPKKTTSSVQTASTKSAATSGKRP